MTMEEDNARAKRGQHPCDRCAQCRRTLNGRYCLKLGKNIEYATSMLCQKTQEPCY